MQSLYIFIACVLTATTLVGQTEDQKKSLNDRLEAAWRTRSSAAFEALFHTRDADQYLIDTKVSWWIHNWKDGDDPELRIVRFVSMAELENLANSKNGIPDQSHYKDVLEDITKPKIMNRNFYVHNLPVAGILEVEVRRNKLTRHDWVVVGLSPEGTLLFTLQKRSEQAATRNH